MTGFEADFVLPSAHVRKAEVTVIQFEDDATRKTSDVRLQGQCLVLEDNMVIALDAADMLSDLGAKHVSTASSVADALTLIGKRDISFALLDVNLGDETSLPVIEKCLELGIPTVLATGYGANAAIVERFPEVPVLSKPYSSDSLKQVAAKALDI